MTMIIIGNANCCSWSQILVCVPQWLILGPLLFFIFLLILNNIDISIYANDRAFITEDKIENVIVFSDWFKSNRLKRNPDN